MNTSANTQRLDPGTGNSGGETAKLLADLIYLSAAHDSSASFLRAASGELNTFTKAKQTVVVQGVKGQWRILASTDEKLKQEALPIDLMAEVLDCERCQSDGGWIASPLNRPMNAGQLLVQQTDSTDETAFDVLAAALGVGLKAYRVRSGSSKRVRQLEALLEMTAGWNQSRETDSLLIEIAEASTRLVGAERATIFLPNSNNTELIGKPALGVEDGTLRIPIGAGVVGQVMSTGEPARVDEDISSEQKQIDRSVDQQLGFQTRTLLCVPMKNADGKTIGAFELINRNEGNFTDRDEAALKELASHATIAIDATQHVEHLKTVCHTIATQAADEVNLIGDAECITKLKSTVERVADTDLAILITGENGTGKEVVAQMIHYLSGRRDEVLVAVNCAAISETLLESELFGHEKGAFTDAHQAREGKFELANGGTLFLDEIGDMSLGGQAKLLRVLEEKVVVRVGGSVPIPTSARVVAATNQDLAKLVGEKKFREDLFFRLNVVMIEIPPLRERGDDVILLAEHFLSNFCAKARRETPKISAAARNRLLGHRWPGNVRELRNMMERLAYLSDGDQIRPDDLAFVNAPQSENADSGVAMDMPLTDATREFQVDYIQRHIDRCGGNMTEAAQRIGLHRSNLYRKMKQLGMSDDD
jgi:Nif-specific regulatory protein